jgi:hypothetical protein
MSTYAAIVPSCNGSPAGGSSLLSVRFEGSEGSGGEG